MSNPNILVIFFNHCLHPFDSRLSSSKHKDKCYPKKKKKKSLAVHPFFFPSSLLKTRFFQQPTPPPHTNPRPLPLLASTSHGPGNETSNRKAVIYNSHRSRPWRRYTVSIRRLPWTLVAADLLQCVLLALFFWQCSILLFCDIKPWPALENAQKTKQNKKNAAMSLKVSLNTNPRWTRRRSAHQGCLRVYETWKI